MHSGLTLCVACHRVCNLLLLRLLLHEGKRCDPAWHGCDKSDL